jgi:zinc transport system substrate-binding protein
LLSVGQAGRADAAAAGKLKVFVGIPPMAYFVERIGGEQVEVGVLVGPGESPHTFEPTPRQMASLAEARLYISVGLPLESRLTEKISGIESELIVVDASDGVLRDEGHKPEDELTEGAGGHAHGHGLAERTGGQVHESESDLHIWLDPVLAKAIAENIGGALVAIDRSHGSLYESNLASLLADLERVDASVREVLAPVRGEEFLVFHPAFGFFGRAYGLKQLAVETEGKEPNARELASLIDRARETGMSAVFVQPQFSTRSAETIARAIGASVVEMDPLAYDYLGNLVDMAGKLISAHDQREN